MTSFETFMSSCNDKEKVNKLAVAVQFASLLKLYTTRLMRSDHWTNYLQDGNLIVTLPRADLNLRLLPPVKVKSNTKFKYAGDMRVSHLGNNIVDWLSYSPLKHDGSSPVDFCPVTPDYTYLVNQVTEYFKRDGSFVLLSLPALALMLYDYCLEHKINISTTLPYSRYGISINHKQLLVTTDRCLVTYVFATPELNNP